MKRLARWLNLYNWLKVAASSLALYVNAIQLSEAADDRGHPLPGYEQEYAERAKSVAWEGVQVRGHLGLVKRNG